MTGSVSWRLGQKKFTVDTLNKITRDLAGKVVEFIKNKCDTTSSVVRVEGEVVVLRDPGDTE